MSTLVIKPNPLIVDVLFSEFSLHVILAVGREISVPLEWFPRLRDAEESDRKDWRLIGNGIGIHWRKLDEDVSVESLLRIK